MSSRAIMGLVLLALGIGYLIQVTNLVPGFMMAPVMRTWWPLLLVLLGVNGLLRHPRRPWWSLLLIAIGVLLILSAVLPGFARLFWPLAGAVALLVLGIRLLLPQAAPGVRHTAQQNTLPVQQEISTEDVVHYQVSFAGVEVSNSAPAFRGGEVSVSFGSLVLDLRGATLAPEGAVLEIKSAFAGVEVVLPPAWPLDVTGSPAFGGWENHAANPRAVAGTPALRLHCAPTFGGVEIRN
jgi:hypothetical protein